MFIGIAWKLELSEEQKFQSFEETQLHFLGGNLDPLCGGRGLGLGAFDHGCLNFLDNGRRSGNRIVFVLCWRMVLAELADHFFCRIMSGAEIPRRLFLLCGSFIFALFVVASVAARGRGVKGLA